MEAGRKLSDDDHGGVRTPRHHVQTNDAKGCESGADFRLGEEGDRRTGAMAAASDVTETPRTRTILSGVWRGVDAWVDGDGLFM